MSQKVDLVIFGGTGDLSTRKLLPALYQLQRHNLADRLDRIIATGRGEMDSASFIEEARNNLQTFLPDGTWDDAQWSAFSDRLEYVKVDADNAGDYTLLAELLAAGSAPGALYYLATLPSLYGEICRQLDAAGIVDDASRVVLEKPLGHDLESCQEINEQVAQVFAEEATFRIDHYLGKETVQNLLALRFGNQLFHPMWNNTFVSSVQITVAEEIGVAGRGSYYADTGALRDMVQNHLLQVLSLVAMEPPATLKATDIRDEKMKVLRSLEPITSANVKARTVRGRYAAGAVGGKAVKGFLEEDAFADADDTETFVALKANINNWRWAGVPFYLRTGKRLSRRYSEIVIEYRRQSFSLFANDPQELTNKLVIHLQPEESISLHTVNKKPGLTSKLKLQPVELHLTDESQNKGDSYDAYERLLLDAIHGDQTLFMRRDEVETAWRWIDSIIEAWEENSTPIKSYNAGTMGPTASTALMAVDGGSWHE
ncbi:glucose-6-phosphate dehydrogenase [Halioglobus japonicus]|uniref:Glucose-6-phosphate 1-dehydrogenase n=1 Tax=Halioglobus japonicus TaxID=930805 RepID=A0AAP8SMZ2_9GAMM|nr:glucose-6-phosphate dehydrogenase [Halioglobus japonicus]AQA17595.1 glucose-6-phosphate dehydrogenase [Halioglobus japonicus]PLW85533.1 glucose-6-phosphate dehydrogenase [Halioglobus japonicus]GHD16142.1 glucose-6-phosphate 1-dehydrogenase [Halioglobus japonicus]